MTQSIIVSHKRWSKLVLQERGVDVSGMKAEDMRLALQQMHDFKYEKTKLKSLIATNGYKGIFILKFHCELNPIERGELFTPRK